MKLFAILVCYKDRSGTVRTLKGGYDLQSFGFFQRESVREFMMFTAKIIIERGSFASRSSLKEQDYMCHTYIRNDGLSAVLVADTEYPQRVAFTLLTKVLSEFEQKISPSSWPTATESTVVYTDLEQFLARYQNPHEADSITRIQDDLDETKIVLHDTIQKVLERGEKLDDLVNKSEGLSMQSKMFYKQARKMNKCCSWV